MAQQFSTSVENNFTKGLITESTGLNFPENAATATDNCEFTIVGDVTRRFGIDYETNFTTFNTPRANNAISTYKWNNVGGDGLTQIVVEQIGSTLYFYRSSSATIAAPLSTTLLSSTVDVSLFVATGGTFDPTIECQFSDGNGYLFVYHPNCDPIYCTYNAGVIVGNIITIKTRDFTGLPEVNVPLNFRPPTLSDVHNYNLQNQGWQQAALWSATSSTVPAMSQPGGFWAINLGTQNFTVQAGIVGIVNGQLVNFYGILVFNDSFGGPPYGVGVNLLGQVTNYAGTTLTLNITGVSMPNVSVTRYSTINNVSWTITVSPAVNQISTWFTAIGNYPSNADIWWIYKNSAGTFAPATTINNFPAPSTPAAKGYFIMNEFNQQRDALSSLTTLTDVTTIVRPKTGTWFQGRVWYTGCDSAVNVSGNAPAYSWTENIYFSQIVNDVSQFGQCYQTNDPTSETLFDLLPTDGGVIRIQGCGSIYKLFPLQNALLVFASNGVWYITGSQGIGFTANDYTIVKLSSIQTISSTSFVDVQGLPYFWNEEGIYKVAPAKQGTGLLSNPLHVNPLELNPITLGTILSFYNTIPLSSKKYARAAYSPIDYTIQWIYRDTEASTITDRYKFNKILNYNTSNNAFFPYTVNNSAASINSILYVVGPGGSTSPDPIIKYVASVGDLTTFAEEHDVTYRDWASTTPVNYESFFVTGYKLKGQAIKQSQPQYLQMYSRSDGITSGYNIQGIWNYAIDRNSNKYGNIQQVTILGSPYHSTVFKRHRIRGSGYTLQFKVGSNTGMPFDIQGWATVDAVNAGT